VPLGTPARAFEGTVPKSSCLAVVASHTDFAVSVTAAGQPGSSAETVWHAFELRDDGSHGRNIDMGLDQPITSCISSAPTPEGYVLALQNTKGTYFADFNTTTGSLNTDIIAGVLQFGGVAKQPTIGCVAPMGSEYGLLFERPAGGEVWRFDAFGNPQGGSLFLPSSAGQVGPLSALPGSDSFLATYLDIGRAASGSTDGNSTGSSRMLVRVDCPQAAPAFSSDAAVGEAGK
jgi:hypothetical protein